MIIAIGIAVVLVAAMIGGILIYRNNRERADKAVDKSKAILDILSK